MGVRHARDRIAALGIGAPHATKIGRVLERLDADALDRLGAWAQPRASARAIAIDGKKAPGAKNGGGTRAHLLAAIDHVTGAVLGQVDVGIKSNEISMFKPLLETIPALGCIVVTATHCTRRPGTPTIWPAGAPITCSRSRETRPHWGGL